MFKEPAIKKWIEGNIVTRDRTEGSNGGGDRTAWRTERFQALLEKGSSAVCGRRSTRTRQESHSSKGRMSQKKMGDIGLWRIKSEEKKCQTCDEVEGMIRSRFYECPCWKGMRQLGREGRKCFLCCWRVVFIRLSISEGLGVKRLQPQHCHRRFEKKASQIVLVVGRWCSCKKVKEGAFCLSFW